MYFGKTAGVVGAIPGTRLAGRSPPARVIPTIIIINRYDYSALFFFLFFVNTALARTELKATIAASLSPILRRRTMATMTIKTTTGRGRGAVEDEVDVVLIINLASCGSITCTAPGAPRANMDRKWSPAASTWVPNPWRSWCGRSWCRRGRKQQSLRSGRHHRHRRRMEAAGSWRGRRCWDRNPVVLGTRAVSSILGRPRWANSRKSDFPTGYTPIHRPPPGWASNLRRDDERLEWDSKRKIVWCSSLLLAAMYFFQFLNELSSKYDFSEQTVAFISNMQTSFLSHNVTICTCISYSLQVTRQIHPTRRSSQQNEKQRAAARNLTPCVTHFICRKGSYRDRFCCVYAEPRAVHCGFRPVSPDRGRHRRGENRRRSPLTAPRDTSGPLGRWVPSTPMYTIPSASSHLRKKERSVH